MIHSFADATTRAVYNNEAPRGFPPEVIPAAKRRLYALEAAGSLDDLAVIPGHRLERLLGDLKGFWSIRVNRQWRVIFRWDNGAHAVRLTDYH